MIKGTAFVIVALSLAVLGFAQGPAPQEKTDVFKVAPADLSGAQADPLQQKALKAYAEKRYEDAARAYVEYLRLRPGQPVALYNLACCFGLLGSGEQASGFLAEAWRAGFKDLGTVERDPDFDGVRQTPAFKAQMEALRKEAAQGGKILPFAALASEHVRIIAPQGLDPSRKYPLVIGLHGAGGDAESFASHLGEAFAAKGVLFAAPQGQYATAGGDSGGIGYVWFRPGDAGPRKPDLLSRKLAEDFVALVLEEVAKNYPVDRENVFLLGFSQGAFLAYSVGLKKSELFRGVIPVGGWVDPADYSRVPRPKLPGFLICHSPEDTDLPMQMAKDGAAFVKELGGRAEVFSYAGGHVVSGEVIRKATEWVTASVVPDKKP